MASAICDKFTVVDGISGAGAEKRTKRFFSENISILAAPLITRKVKVIFTKRSGLVLAIGMACLAVPAAYGQATRTWISGVGDDVNPCSRTAPCKTFAGAISKTAAGGEIDALDPGGFGGVTIVKAITLAAEGAGEAGILIAGTNGITINAGVNDVVVLRGLQIDGGPLGSNSLAGVKFIAGGSLIIQNCAIRNFTGGAPNGYGISFTPSGEASLFVSDTVVSNNGNGMTGGGIFIQPAPGGGAKATLARVNVLNSVFGIRADGTTSTAGISVAISDSVASGNTFSGITAFTPVGGAPTTMDIIRSVTSNNGTGLNANGPTAVMRIGFSLVTGNGIGATISNAATIISLGNNFINDNTTVGSVLPISGTQ